MVIERFADVAATAGTAVVYSAVLPCVEAAAVLEAVGAGTTAVVGYVGAVGAAAVAGTPNAVVVVLRDAVTGAPIAGTVPRLTLLVRG